LSKGFPHRSRFKKSTGGKKGEGNRFKRERRKRKRKREIENR